MLMWVAILVLWLGGAYFSGVTSTATSGGTNLPACSNRTLSVGFAGQDPYLWWISTSGIIVIITVAASCLYCCSFMGAFCGGLPPVVTYISIAGLIVALLGYSVFLAWIGVGSYLAAMVTNSARCVSYIFYLIFFYFGLLSLVVCGTMSVVWKVHAVQVSKGKNASSDDKKALISGAV